MFVDFTCGPSGVSTARRLCSGALTPCKTSREVIECLSTPSLIPNANVF